MIIRSPRRPDRIRLIAIEIMKGAFGNEGALRFSGHRWREFGFFAEKRKHFFNQRVGCDAVFLS